MMRLNLRVVLALVWFGFAGVPAIAHEVRPAYLEITEHAGGRIDALFKQPSTGLQAVRLDPHLSGGALDHAPTRIDAGAGFQTRTWANIALAGPLGGRTISIAGLDRSITDVLVVVKFADGHRAQALLRPGDSTLKLGLRGDDLSVFTYLSLGIEHILTGYDHLLFVLGLVLLVPNVWTLTKTITAFTAAHSITLALTALGLVTVAPAKIEALVALSILFVAVELTNVSRGRSTITQRSPWLIAFTFGLLHGSALAGALSEVGLPRANIPGALFLFNLGVEIGQLSFVAAILAVRFALRRLPVGATSRLAFVPQYAIGVAAAFWMLERLQAAVFS